MDILHLNYFLAVAHHKSFTKAAQALHISQPSISKSIRTLEEEWGVTLFHRHSRDIELTEVGQALLPKIKTIVGQFQQLSQQMSDKKTLQHGELVIGIPPMVGTRFISPLLAEFHTLYPHISIAVEEWGGNKVAKSILDGGLQVGYISLPITNMPKNNYIFHNEPLKLVLPSHHRLANFKKLRLEDVKDEPFALFTEEFSLHQAILNNFQNIGIRPEIICRSSNWDFIAEMVRAEIGLAILPASICERLNPRDYHIADFEPTVYWRLSMVWSHDVFISTPTRLWIDFFKSRMPEISVTSLQNMNV